MENLWLVIKRIINKYLPIVFIVCLLGYILVSSILITYRVYTLVELSAGLIYGGLSGLLIYIINKILNKFKFDIYDLFILGLVICGVIASFCAIDFKTSLFGFPGRYEGLFQLGAYYILFLICKGINSNKARKILVFSIIFLGVLHSLYGLIQFVDIKNIYGLEIIRNRFYSTGFELNPNFLGSLTILCLSLSLGIYFFRNKVWGNILMCFVSIILFLGLLCSGAMSAMVAFIFLIIILIIIFFILKKNIKEFIVKGLIVLIFFILGYLLFNNYDNGYYFSQVKKTTVEASQVLVGNTKDIYGSGRIYIWKKTLGVVPDNLFTGVGIDNFYYAFGDRRLIDVKSGYAVDKAHNEYLQKLVTEGIFSFMIYLIMLFIIFIKSLKRIIKLKVNDWLFIACFLAFVSYCIQAFFNISVISVAPCFYIIMGILNSFWVGGNDEGDEY